jgi:hypothetical protein
MVLGQYPGQTHDEILADWYGRSRTSAKITRSGPQRPAAPPLLNPYRASGVLTFDTGFRRLPVQRLVRRQCLQDFGGVAGQERCDGQAEVGEAAVHGSGKIELDDVTHRLLFELSLNRPEAASRRAGKAPGGSRLGGGICSWPQPRILNAQFAWHGSKFIQPSVLAIDTPATTAAGLAKPARRAKFRRTFRAI